MELNFEQFDVLCVVAQGELLDKEWICMESGEKMGLLRFNVIKSFDLSGGCV